MENYKVIVGGVIRMSDGLTMCDGLPQVAAHWQEYQAWLKAGNKPLPADEPAKPGPIRDLAAEIDSLKALIRNKDA